ncbi:GAF domain-containing protein [Streptomyces sp. NBC_00198]|uniref:GAF domain-containing protein n=1 Tax=Streptomyces sp. NBC_00198 TaxID=2975677 RepID=UPI002253DB8E|nr:GAF domain-containing protein [Streptomyces sp. NBC_00198]MCX5280904.1 GAF domain-containing protein [Streptomyces sp. NBC_00198]
MGNVQLAEHGMLRLEKHTGLNEQFTDFFAFVQDSTAACAQAARQCQQVTVKDVESADIFDEDSRQAILQAGSRAAHSLPLISRAGQVIGLISSHHEHPLSGFSRPQLTALAPRTPWWAAGCTGIARPRCWMLWSTSTPLLARRAEHRSRQPSSRLTVRKATRRALPVARCRRVLAGRVQALVDAETASGAAARRLDCAQCPDPHMHPHPTTASPLSFCGAGC